MKITLLTDGIYPYAVGGMQKHSYHLAKHLAKNGHTVYLFHCNESKYDTSKLEFFTEEGKKNIHSFIIPFPHKSYYPLHYITESKLYSKLIYDQLLPVLSEINFVFAQGFCAWHLLKNKPANCPPIAVHFHGLEMFQNIPQLKAKISSVFLRKAVKQNLELADYGISYGGNITTILKRLIPANKIWEIPGAIEASWVNDNIKPVGDKVKFIFVGRFERRKGIPELNKAIENLLPSNNFTFDFIGDIPEEYKLNSPLLHYHGKVSSEAEVKKLLSQSDVLVSPSYAEGMPVSIMEAMAQGLAIIATNVGSVSTLVDENNGWLISSPEPELIAEAMTKAIKSKDSLIAKKQESNKRIQTEFLVEQTTAKLIKLIEEVK